MKWLFIILTLSLLVRFYHLSYPLGELHSWRQADTAAVARSFTAYGSDFWLPLCQVELRHIGEQGQECRIPLLNPQFDSYVTIDGKATWQDGRPHTNNTRNHFAEFPLYQAIVAQTALILDTFPALISFLRSMSFWVDVVFATFDKGRGLFEPAEFEYFVNNFNSISFDSVVFAGRLVSLISSLLSLVAIYFLVKFYFQERVALGAAVVFGLLPYSVFWSRTVLPDTMMVMWFLWGLVFFHAWLSFTRINGFRTKKSIFLFFLFTICFTFALLMKLFVLFLLIPLIYLLFINYNIKIIRNPWLWVSLFLILMPFLLWRYWIHIDILRLPGIPASDWLFNGSSVRLKPAWWYWLFQTRLDHYMFNFPGLVFGGIGLLLFKEVNLKLGRDLDDEKSKLIYFWPLTLLSCFIYLVVFATGNVQHEYYQLPLVPFISVFVSLGFWYVWGNLSLLQNIFQKIACISFLGLIFLFGSYKVMNWYASHNPSYVFAATRASLLIPENATVIADFGGDTTMLYYTKRPGWSIMELNVEQLISRGATHYISAYRTEGVNEMAKKYEVIEESTEYVILDLTKPQSL